MTTTDYVNVCLLGVHVLESVLRLYVVGMRSYKKFSKLTTGVLSASILVIIAAAIVSKYNNGPAAIQVTP